MTRVDIAALRALLLGPRCTLADEMMGCSLPAGHEGDEHIFGQLVEEETFATLLDELEAHRAAEAKHLAAVHVAETVNAELDCHTPEPVRAAIEAYDLASAVRR